MFTSTKKPLQVRMGKEKAQSTVGSNQLGNESHFEMSRQDLKYKNFRDYLVFPYKNASKVENDYQRAYTRRETNFLLKENCAIS